MTRKYIRVWDRGGKKHVLETYLKLHKGKVGLHWIWAALDRVANGESEIDVMKDYDYEYIPHKKEL